MAKCVIECEPTCPGKKYCNGTCSNGKKKYCISAVLATLLIDIWQS